MPAAPAACPCGAKDADGRLLDYAEHCRPLHEGTVATTAEALMRSRYSAHARRDVAYLRATWDPATCPVEIDSDPAIVFTGLDVIRTERGGALDADGVVEFRAHFRRSDASTTSELHEISRFRRSGLGWLYVDGTHPL